MKILIITLVALSCCLGCRKVSTFSPEELQIILIVEGGKMMQLATVNDPQDSLLLRRIAKELTPGDMGSKAYQTLKSGMLKTVNDKYNPGVGIAAPQVGISRRLIAVQRFDKAGEPFEFYANPEILSFSGEKIGGIEGCLSIPGVADSVWRSSEVVVGYRSEPGFKEARDTVRGFTAVIFQHEIDHLDGKLFIDYKLTDCTDK